MVHSCERCSIRKVKCDRQQPSCSACVRLNAECVYHEPAPPRRKKKRDRNEILTGRLKQYGRSLQQKGVQADASPQTSESNNSHLYAGSSVLELTNTSSSLLPDPSSPRSMRVSSRSQLLHDENRSKYLENGLWTRVVEELAEPADALEHSSDDDDDNDGDIADDSMDFVLGLTPSPTPVSIESLHPSPDQILALWEVFLENVDPLTKVVHGPTLQPAIRKALANLSAIPKPLEALLFSIYGAAVVSLKNPECERKFSESRKVLLSRYRMATKAALSRAKFLGSANLAVLQALLIHLFSMRDAYDSRTLWTFIGIALRIAEGMGLHRDGSSLGLSVFETEIRRRVWWQMKMFEGRSAELSGSDRLNTLDTNQGTPKLPANVNDDELYPGLSSPPVETNRATDMVFCSLRFDIRSYWTTYTVKQRQKGKHDYSPWDSFGSSANLKERDQVIDDYEQILEAKYIRYCDPSQPIQLMAMVIARGGATIMRLLAHHPRRWGSEDQIPDSEREYVWNLGLQLLRQWNMVFASNDLERFSWHAAFYFQWQAFIQILDTLRVNPLVQEAVQVWQLIDELYQNHPDFVNNIKKPLYVAVGNLCLKAYTAREAALATGGQPIPPTPSYIKTFRRQREAANARRVEQEAARKKDDVPNMILSAVTQLTSADQTAQADGGWKHMKSADHGPQLPHKNSVQFAGAWQSQSSMDNNASWRPEFAADQSGGFFTFTDEPANVDMDMLLAPDTALEDPINQSIDWAKWDTLLGNSI